MRNGAARSLTLVRDKWEIGGGAMSWRWAGQGVERSHGLSVPFHSFYFLLYCPQKVTNGNCKRAYEGKSIPKKLSISG